MDNERREITLLKATLTLEEKQSLLNIEGVKSVESWNGHSIKITVLDCYDFSLVKRKIFDLFKRTN